MKREINDLNDIASAQLAGEEVETETQYIDTTTEKPTALSLRAEVILPGNGVSFSETAKQLFPILAQNGRTFIRGGRVVDLTAFGGSEKLKIMTPAAARSQFDKAAYLSAYRSNGNGDYDLKRINVCPEETAKGLLESEEARTLLPEIVGIVNFPLITENGGQIHITDRGYDQKTKIFITGGIKPPKIDFLEACEKLEKILCDFDFVTPSDKSRAFASILTPALKLGGFINGSVPCDVAEADQSQSGKTYRQKLIVAIYNERLSIITHRDGGVGGFDESFNQALVEGSPFIQLENLRGKMDSQHIEAFMTSEGYFPARIPHQGNIGIDPSKYFLFLTSNGVESTRDFANRSSIVRIRKHPASYQFQEYPEGDLAIHIKANQPYYLGCVFSVIEKWCSMGKPKKTPPNHDFREWASILGGIVEFILDQAPLMEGHLIAQNRVSNPSLNFARNLCVVMDRENEWGNNVNASQIAEFAFHHEIEIPGLKDDDSGDVEKANKVIGTKMSKLFKESDQCIIDNFCIDRLEQDQYRAGGGTYKSKTYTFGKKPA